MPVNSTGRTNGEYVANKGSFDECSCGKRLAIVFGTTEMRPTSQSATLQLTVSNRGKRRRTGDVVPSAAVDPLLRERTRYDARGNVITSGTHADQTYNTPAVVTVPAVVVYALMTADGELLAVACESEIEAVYDSFEDETLEIVPC